MCGMPVVVWVGRAGFTKGYCGHTDVTGMWEPLYHHGGDWTCNSTANPDDCYQSKVSIGLNCGYNNTLTGLDPDEDGFVQSIFVWLADAEGKYAAFEVPLREDWNNIARRTLGGGGGVGDGALTDSWVHFAVTVDQDRIIPYVDGVEEKIVGFNSQWGDTPENLAWFNTSDGRDGFATGGRDWDAHGVGLPLTQPLGPFNFTRPGSDFEPAGEAGIYFGMFFGHHSNEHYDGYIAGLGVYSRAISDAEVNCLFKYGETHLAIPR